MYERWRQIANVSANFDELWFLWKTCRSLTNFTTKRAWTTGTSARITNRAMHCFGWWRFDRLPLIRQNYVLKARSFGSLPHRRRLHVVVDDDLVLPSIGTRLIRHRVLHCTLITTVSRTSRNVSTQQSRQTGLYRKWADTRTRTAITRSGITWQVCRLSARSDGVIRHFDELEYLQWLVTISLTSA